MTACSTSAGAGDESDRITVLLDEPEDSVAEWNGGAADFDGHPYVPEGVEIDVAFPRFTGAEPFAEELAVRVDQEVRDFRAASRDPRILDIGWEVSAAGNGVLGVRLTRTEEDLHGLRHGYETYWYDSANQHTAYSTELLKDQDALDELNGLAREALADDADVDADGVHPVLRTYDSMGFNGDGDLVVEFDDGHLSPIVVGHPPSAEPGRETVVVDYEEAAPLLADLGERARDASLVEEPEWAVPAPDAGAEEPGPAPGVVESDRADVDCHDGETKSVALTFDDGPAETTPHLLDLLAEEDVRASFFLNGDPALTRPSVFRRAYAEGHEVASHNDLHEHMPEFGVQRLPQQVSAVSAIVRRQTGHTVTLFRPPFGASSPDVLAEIGEQEMAEVLWNADSEDWTEIEPGGIVEQVVGQARPGGVVLLHDTLPTTLSAMPEIIERLREKDYEFVSVAQVFDGPDAGESYPPEGHDVPGSAGA